MSEYFFLKNSYQPYLKAPWAEYPRRVGPHPVKMPRTPSALYMIFHPWTLLL